MVTADGGAALFAGAAACSTMLPPEVTSGLLYSGPGGESLLAAAMAWDGLATELHSAATSCHTTLASLTGTAWTGPSSVAMATAAAPFVAWLAATATQANQTATQVRAAAGAYRAALAAAVPPVAVAANRAQLSMLLTTNVFGVNTAAIAAVEAQYQQMWAQDAVAMHGYAASAAAATRLTPFTTPAKNTNPASSTGTGAQSVLGGAAQQMSHVYGNMYASAADIGKGGLMANDSMGSINMAEVEFKTFFKPPGLPPIPKSDLGAGLAGLGGLGGPAGLKSVGPAGFMRAVSADVGNAPVVGSLSVPPSWGTATPAIRLAATGIPNTGAGLASAAPAAAVPEGLSGLGALQSLGAGAMGGSAPAAIKGAAFRTGGAGKKGEAPVQLDRVIAHLQRRRDAVQHWQVDQAGLDGLLDELSKKPGFHAVHVSKSSVTTTNSR